MEFQVCSLDVWNSSRAGGWSCPWGGVAAAEKVFQGLLARREGAGPVLDENDFNNLGYKLLKQMNLESALYVFEKNAVLFPTSANVYDSLGEALAIAGRREQAIEG